MSGLEIPAGQQTMSGQDDRFSWLVILIWSSAWLSNKINNWNNKFSHIK